MISNSYDPNNRTLLCLIDINMTYCKENMRNQYEALKHSLNI